jgi:hypothetical protein
MWVYCISVPASGHSPARGLCELHITWVLVRVASGIPKTQFLKFENQQTVQCGTCTRFYTTVVVPVEDTFLVLRTVRKLVYNNSAIATLAKQQVLPCWYDRVG